METVCNDSLGRGLIMNTTGLRRRTASTAAGLLLLGGLLMVGSPVASAAPTPQGPTCSTPTAHDVTRAFTEANNATRGSMITKTIEASPKTCRVILTRGLSLQGRLTFTVAGGGRVILDLGGRDGTVIVTSHGGALSLTNFSITGGDGSATPGGIYNDKGTVTLNNVVISGNHGANGGGIDVSGGPLTLKNSTVTGNIAHRGGGIMADSGATVTVTNSKITDNTAQEGSGGIDSDERSKVTVESSTITGNKPTNCRNVPGCWEVDRGSGERRAVGRSDQTISTIKPTVPLGACNHDQRIGGAIDQDIDRAPGLDVNQDCATDRGSQIPGHPCPDGTIERQCDCPQDPIQ